MANQSLISEFFEFLKNGYENELETYFLKFNSNIEKGVIKFLNSISEYSFFDTLR